MPHCQKENHNRAGKSKKERNKAKQELSERKQRLRDEQAAAEAEALKTGNNIAPIEGHGEYEVGCEPEVEFARFNVKKRSKKHLRNDLRKRMLREAEEEEERSRKAREEEYERERLALKRAARGDDGGSSCSEEEDDEDEYCNTSPAILEYFVFICECCDKKYATKNQFINHVNSKKHKSKVRIYEELGLLVTHVELRGENGNDKELYDDGEEDNEEWDNAVDNGNGDNDDDDDDDDGGDEMDGKIPRGVDDESDDDDVGNANDDSDGESDHDDDFEPPKQNMFAGFDAGFSSSSEEEESSDDSDNDDDSGSDDGDRKLPPASAARLKEEEKKEEDDAIDFDELIHQNQLIQEEIDAEQKQKAEDGTIAKLPAPVPFHETYDPEDYGVNENRLASVQHRLRKNIAAKGIAPSEAPASSAYDPLDAVAMGNTLLQQVLEANIDTLQQKLDVYRKHKQHCELMAKQHHAVRKGNSKALPAQYVRKQDHADNAAKRAIVHHAGSHYHMQAARSMQFGRTKGLMARHSAQGSRLQASRMVATETARMNGGMKVGKKTSKKSSQKKRGEAGGSKKTGGNKGAGGGD